MDRQGKSEQDMHCRRIYFLASILAAVGAGLCLPVSSAEAQNGALKLNLKTAAGATELPVGPWGAYSAAHAGPCYLASRRLAPLFAFPIVVGQQRDEVLPIGSRTVDGRTRLRPERISLLRRASGLSPTASLLDAAGPAPVARIVDADADNLLTTAAIAFPPAALSREVAIRRDVNGAPLPGQSWSAATATVTWSPAFAGTEAEGLIVRVSLTNPGGSAQEFFVDILGGLDRGDPQFASADIAAAPDTEGRGITLKHSKFDTWFALAAQPGDYVTRSLAVSSDLFAADANTAPKDATGGVVPSTAAGAPRTWALTGLSGIGVGPGETRTVFLCVGIGRDADSALESARTLLSLAEERKAGSVQGRESLFTLADKAHDRARYRSGREVIDRLMAQSLANTPFHDMRRIGVPGRDGAGYYRPGLGGWMALGWSGYRPDWAAAQLNAWFLTGTPPQKAVNHVMAVPPVDIIALWDLLQRTHDRDMLEKFYPYALWRFREFLESGREREDDWLFTWPMPKDKPVTRAGFHALSVTPASIEWKAPLSLPEAHPLATTRTASFAPELIPDSAAVYAPDYSAYIILSARILLACAKFLEKPPDEQASLAQVIERASQAMTRELWDAKRGLFVVKPVSTPDAVTVMERGDMALGNGLESLLPFLIGPELLTPEQDAALRRHLQDSSTFLSPYGLRSLSMKSGSYRGDDADRGGVRFGWQWLIWKALLDRGDAIHAADLASRVIGAYESAVDRSGGYPEWLNGESGAACGRLDSSADACALIALYESYHRAGTVTTGWDTNLLDHHYDGAADSLRIVFRGLARAPKGVLLCVMGKPGGVYHATGGVTGNFTADAGGVVTLHSPDDPTTQQVEISPAGSQK